jgi:nickel-type superoxide dismutase maturation protease
MVEKSGVRRDTIPVRFAFGRLLVHGPSMAPTLRHGDQLLVRRTQAAAPGTIVVVALPDGVLAVKRLVRRDESGSVWVEGDNPFGSTDSRTLGALPSGAVSAVVVARLWPRPTWLSNARTRPAPSPE